MDNPIITVNNLNKYYGKKQILKDISFKVNPGDCVAVVGANGCGKSTLLKLLTGADTKKDGTITILGKDISQNKNYISRHVGYIPQENPLFENLTVIDNLKLWYGDSSLLLDKELSDGKLSFFGLSQYKKYKVSKLSGGMKKRLSIACAIAHDPEILVLDEPGASLDLVCKQDIRNFLSEYNKTGGTIIITSHEQYELSLCNRMFLIKDSMLNEIPPVEDTKLMELIKQSRN